MFKAFFYFLGECWKLNWKYPTVLFLKNVTQAVITVCLALLPKFIVDAIFIAQNREQAIFWIVFLIGAEFILFMGLQLWFRLEYTEANRTVQRYDIKFANRMMRAHYETIESEYFLNLKEKASRYVSGYGKGFGAVLQEGFGIIGHLVGLGGLAAIIYTLHPLVVVALVVIVVLQTIFVSKSMAPIQNYNLECSVVERRSRYFNDKINDFQYGKEIRNYKLKNILLGKYRDTLNKELFFYKKVGNANLKVGLFSGIGSILQLCVGYFYLFKQSFAGLVSVGDFSMYLTAITSFFAELSGVINGFLQLSQFKVLYQAYKEYIDTPIEQLSNDNKPALPERFEVAFEDVSFKYGSAENFALENVSVKFNNKERIAIIGENGAGKSTFVKLLMRLYKPTSGRILLNGVDINEIDYEYYQTLFATVFQDFKLFSFSIRDNITFGSEQNAESEARLEKILRTTGVAEMVEGLEQGLDTNMYRDFDDAGFTPSGGQGQKIAIARAAYKDSPIVILDEPTAALDPRAENQIYEQFDEFFKDRCSLYISHRMAVTKFSDRTLVFDAGHIVQDGTHETLVAVDGKYKELYDLQAQYYTE